MSGNEQVLVEIQTFLVALASYADRVASDPKVTFKSTTLASWDPLAATHHSLWREPLELARAKLRRFL